MLLSIPDESLFHPNPSEKHTQPILKDDAGVLQEARDCLDDILKDKSPTEIGRTKLFKMDILTKGPPTTCTPYPIPLKCKGTSWQVLPLLVEQ